MFGIININSTDLCRIFISMFKLEIICNQVDRIQYCVILLKCFVESLSMIHWLCNKKILLLIANMFGNQKRSIISARMLIIEASKINTYVKGHK